MTSLFKSNIFSAFYGPYHKRWPRGASISLKKLNRSHSDIENFIRLNAEEFEGGATISNIYLKQDISAGTMTLTVPSTTRVSSIGLFGKSLLWDGHTVELVSPTTLSIRIPLITNGISVQSIHQDILILLEDEKPIGAGFLSMLRQNLEFKKPARLFAGSFATHALILGIAFMLKFMVLSNTHNTDTNTDLAKEEIEIVTPQKLQAAANFSGEQLKVVQPKTISPEAKVEKLSKALSSISSRLATFGALRINGFKQNKKESQVTSAALRKLTDKLSQTQSSALVAQMILAGSGATGKGLSWGLFSKPGQAVSNKDQEQVATIFRGLQGQFRECYEKVLLKDAELEVTISYQGQVLGSGGLGAPDFSLVGNYQPHSGPALTQCLSGVLNKVRVPQSLSGTIIKNEFLFKS